MPSTAKSTEDHNDILHSSKKSSFAGGESI